MKQSLSKYRTIAIHTIAWGLILCLPLFVVGLTGISITAEGWTRYLAFPLSVMIVFYTNYSFLIDRFLLRKRSGLFLLCNLAVIACVMTVIHLLLQASLIPQAMSPVQEHRETYPVPFLIGNVVIYVLAVGVGTTVRMTKRWYETEAARKDLEHARTVAELEQLKNQLNPHFLFNTLNNIYSFIRSDAAQAQRMLDDLCRLLRYVLYDCNRPTVPLSEEIDFLRNYIELMRIRLPQSVRLSVSLPTDTRQTFVAPMLFTSLVENAFKHGVRNDRPSFVSIDIRMEGHMLTGEIKNSNYPKTSSDSRSGVGLDNLRKRLDLLYADRYCFECGVRDSVYHVVLKVDLGESTLRTT
ncbi:sensor histidine kinase [Alistipes finegoldii]|uniref:sensor histidine kinase n=1 Tax=Alistipes finegoldii TaxID=214856 RepID=UPI003A959FB5